MIKRQLQTVQRHSHRCFTSSSVRKAPPAFVFDIDGVLLRGETVLEPAKNAFRILHGDNPYKRKLPYVFLTNGGGVSEKQRCERLSSQLGFEVSPKQYIQSHTVLKSISHKYVDKPVLVIGGKGDVMRQVAHSYGFNEVYTPLDILAWNKAVHPFHDLSANEQATIHSPVDFSNIKFKAIIVCHDPRNWGMDIQIMCDILLGNGYITAGTPQAREKKPTAVDVIFCNPDLLWKNEFEVSRFGQGGFRFAWEAVWRQVRGGQKDPPIIQYGKPHVPTYSFARNVLEGVVKDEGLELVTKPVAPKQVTGFRTWSGAGKENAAPQQSEKLLNVYMVGDNPESDICGANTAGMNSILVHTGVFQPHKQPMLNGIPRPLEPLKRPGWEAADVECAVRLAIDEELRKERGERSTQEPNVYL